MSPSTTGGGRRPTGGGRRPTGGGRRPTGGGRRPARWAALALVSCAGPLLAACGVGTDASPTIVNKTSVPYGLLQPAPPTTDTTTTAAYVTVYLEGSERLVAVSEPVAAPVTVASVLQAVSEGPTARQASEGLASPISSATPLSFDHLVGAVATVTISPSFTKLAEKQQEVAVAQLVYALTAFPGVSSVEIRIHGHSVEVPTDHGTLQKGPVTRAEYTSFAPY